MNPRGLNTAMELYRSGTLTLPQAAQRAGCTEAELLRALHSSGLCVGPVDGGPTAAD